MNKTGLKLTVSVVLLIFVFGCAGTRQKAPSPPSAKETSQMDESFDPLSLNDEDITFPESEEVLPNESSFESPVEQENLPAEENKQVDGFRIQLFSTKDIENATRAKNIAAEQLSDLNEQIYLEFDSPYYKVRIGDFKTREEAERVRDIVRSRGYPKAWIVKTKVWSHPQNQVPTESQDFLPRNNEN